MKSSDLLTQFKNRRQVSSLNKTNTINTINPISIQSVSHNKSRLMNKSKLTSSINSIMNNDNLNNSQQARIKDLCNDDKKKIGDLLNMLAQEKKEKLELLRKNEEINQNLQNNSLFDINCLDTEKTFINKNNLFALLVPEQSVNCSYENSSRYIDNTNKVVMMKERFKNIYSKLIESVNELDSINSTDNNLINNSRFLIEEEPRDDIGSSTRQLECDDVLQRSNISYRSPSNFKKSTTSKLIDSFSEKRIKYTEMLKRVKSNSIKYNNSEESESLNICENIESNKILHDYQITNEDKLEEQLEIIEILNKKVTPLSSFNMKESIQIDDYENQTSFNIFRQSLKNCSYFNDNMYSNQENYIYKNSNLLNIIHDLESDYHKD